MWRAAAWSSMGGVDAETVVIRLELRMEESVLAGCATAGSGETREFEGWLGLMAAIGALVPAGPEPDRD